MIKLFPISFPLGYTFIVCNVYLFLPRLASCDNPSIHVTGSKDRQSRKKSDYRGTVLTNHNLRIGLLHFGLCENTSQAVM